METGVELAPLHMPLRSEPYEFPQLPPATFYRLPALLADALPDAFGNALVNAWMAEQGVATDEHHPARPPGLCGRPGHGRARVPAHRRARWAANRRPPSSWPIWCWRRACTVGGEFAGDETAHAALQQLIQVGTSAGGARAKAVVAFNPSTFQVRSAYGPPAEGFEQWLIKLDGVSGMGMDGHGDRLGDTAPYGRIEYAYSLMAGTAGIEMTPCLLLAEGPRRHFMTRRFDRGPGGERIHIISLCALAHLDYNLVATHSYDQYLQVVSALGLGSDELRQAYRRMVFNVMAVNRDDHTKNFAFLRPRSGDWRLTPAFDVTHAYRPDSQWTSRHLMAVNGKFEGITLEDLHAVGDRNDVPGYRRVVREVRDAVTAWPAFAAQAELDDELTESIAADIERFRPR